jgi:hypothetical protein
LFIFGCTIGSQNNDGNNNQSLLITNGISKTQWNEGKTYEITGNPLFTKANAGNEPFHFTGDPAVCVAKQGNEDILMMLTSCDELNRGSVNYKMHNTYLYMTNSNFISDNNKWIWHGPGNFILQEDDFAWSAQANRFYAPDIQYDQTSNRIYVYVATWNKQNDQRITVSYTDTSSSSLYNLPLNNQTNDPFVIDGKKYNLTVPYGGYSYDPGVFYDDPIYEPGYNGKYGPGYYMSYCNTKADDWREKKKTNALGLVKMNNMSGGDYLGYIKIKCDQNSDYKPDLSTYYMEGPDLNIMTTKNGKTLYYLIFAAKMDWNNTVEYIGYATATPKEFRDNPLECWQFQGWIFKDIERDGSIYEDWTNHADLVQYYDKYYVFFHKRTSDQQSDSGSRQMCIKEIELNDDGKIVGVEPNNFDTLDGNTKSISKGFVDIRDEGSTEGNITKPRISSLKNITDNPISGFKAFYYFDIEPGKNVVVDKYYLSNCDLTLQHIGSKTWAIVMNYSGNITLNPGESLSNSDVFGIHYSDWSTFNKTNDFSQPVANYNTWTTRMALKDYNDNLLCGEIPKVKADTTKYISSQWTTYDNKQSYLTCTTQNANDGINCQFLDTGLTRQEWFIYDVGNVENGVRVKNLSSGYYMTCNNDKLQNNQYYWLLSQKLNESWDSQIWIKEYQGYGIYKLRCRWKATTGPLAGKDLYLSLTNTGDKKDVYVQPDGGKDYPRIFWRID